MFKAFQCKMLWLIGRSASLVNRTTWVQLPAAPSWATSKVQVTITKQHWPIRNLSNSLTNDTLRHHISSQVFTPPRVNAHLGTWNPTHTQLSHTQTKHGPTHTNWTFAHHHGPLSKFSLKDWQILEIKSVHNHKDIQTHFCLWPEKQGISNIPMRKKLNETFLFIQATAAVLKAQKVAAIWNKTTWCHCFFSKIYKRFTFAAATNGLLLRLREQQKAVWKMKQRGLEAPLRFI